MRGVRSHHREPASYRMALPIPPPTRRSRLMELDPLEGGAVGTGTHPNIPGPMKDDRYQFQSWLVRRWRDRWLVMIPVWAIRMWWGSRTRRALRQPGRYATRMQLNLCWDISCGVADLKRKWTYSWDEMELMCQDKTAGV